jgi:hypothetical protein
LIETAEDPAGKPSPILQIADFGDMVWQKVADFFDAARVRVQVAWTWLVGTIQA